jgi:hypothetical protein
MSFVLVLYIYAGVLARGDSVAMHSVPMPTMAACEREGRKAEALVKGSAKDLRFVCLDTRQ